MLDTIREFLELFMMYGVPVLPYACIAFVSHMLMSKFFKPLITSHKGKDGKYADVRWRWARRCMVFYPMIMGSISALFFGLNLGYAVTAAMCAQVAYLILKQILKRKGIDLPEESATSLLPPEE